MSAQPIVRGGGPSNHSIYDVRTEQAHPIGTEGWLPDGRKFRYARNGGSSALDVGKLMVEFDLNTNQQNLATTTTALIEGDSKVTGVTVGTGGVTANEYKEGYLAVTDGGGQGHMFQIRSHDEFAAAASGTFHIYGSIPSAAVSDAGTTVSLHYNPYDTPQESKIDQADVPVGVPTTTIPAGNVTAYFGWLQVSGRCPVLFDEAVAAFGDQLTIGTGVTGAVEAADAANEPVVGYTVAAGVDTEYQMIKLAIE